MAESPAVFLRTIAAKVGFAKSTVSMALRNDPRIPIATRKRIQEAAREVGYHPHALIATLMAQVRAGRSDKTSIKLALLNAYSSNQPFREISPLYEQYVAGAMDHALTLGYEIEEFWTKAPGMARARLQKILHTRNITGILLSPVPFSHGHLSLDWTQFAVATIGWSLYKPDCSRAVPDLYQGTLLAYRKLRRLGYRRPGLAMPASEGGRIHHLVYAAALVEQSGMKASDRVPPLIAKVWNEEVFIRWLKKYEPDVVIYGYNDAKEWMERCGLRIPEDIGYVTLQWQPDRSALAGLNVNPRLIGAAAVDLIIGQLHRNESGIPTHPKTISIRGDWVDGASAPPRNRAR